MKFKDYYNILGVDKTAGKDDIRKAYRKLARKYHPDVNKSPDAEQKYKDINEAYEVLKDPDKRQKYDTLGSSWQEGDNFSPPPGYERRSANFDESSFGGFSEFFRTVFGGSGGFGNMEDIFFSGRNPSYQGSSARRGGQDAEAQLEISLEDAFRGGSTSITLESHEPTEDGRFIPRRKNIKVNIPKGVTDGTRLRLPGKGNPGIAGTSPGDLYLNISIRKHPRFEVRGHDLVTSIKVSPWEAALGADVSVRSIDGSVKMKLPAGTQSGQTLRLRGKGLPKKSGTAGDLLVKIQIMVPGSLTDKEKKLFERLAEESSFSPRD